MIRMVRPRRSAVEHHGGRHLLRARVRVRVSVRRPGLGLGLGLGLRLGLRLLGFGLGLGLLGLGLLGLGLIAKAVPAGLSDAPGFWPSVYVGGFVLSLAIEPWVKVLLPAVAAVGLLGAHA